MFLERNPFDPNYRPLYEAETLCFWLRLLANLVTTLPIKSRQPIIQRMEMICGRLRGLGNSYWPDVPWLGTVIEAIEFEIRALGMEIEDREQIAEDSLSCPRCGRPLESYPVPWPVDLEYLTSEDTTLAPSNFCQCKWCLTTFYKLFNRMVDSDGLDLVEL